MMTKATNTKMGSSQVRASHEMSVKMEENKSLSNDTCFLKQGLKSTGPKVNKGVRLRNCGSEEELSGKEHLSFLLRTGIQIQGPTW